MSDSNSPGPEFGDRLRDQISANTPDRVASSDSVHADARRTRRRRSILTSVLASAAVVAVVATVIAVGGTDKDDSSLVADEPKTSESAATPTPEPSPSEPTVTEPVEPAGPTGAFGKFQQIQCSEDYSAKGLKKREFAFDGVVVSHGPSVSNGGGFRDVKQIGTTFKVKKWYVGGKGAKVTVDLDKAPVGTRLLVSGESRAKNSTGPLDHPIGWSCGFTRYWDQATADSWTAAFGS